MGKLIVMLMCVTPSGFCVVTAYLLVHGHPWFALLFLVAAVIVLLSLIYED